MKSQPNFFLRLVESGVAADDSLVRRRNIIFSNYIALILCAANIFLFVIIPQNRNLGGLSEALISVGIFSLPILLNRWSLNHLSRLYLCWVPPILITWWMMEGMKQVGTVPVSSYDGLRIYLVATSCIPYLLVERTDKWMFIASILPNLLILVFCDYLLEAAGVGYDMKGARDDGYGFTTLRSFIAYVVVGGSCLALRFIVDQTDSRNQKLIAELELKNTIIQKQSESELNRLNQILQNNLGELTKREIILKGSQEIAKVGSWVFNFVDKSVYWSDQMYEIFGVDKSINLQSPHLTSLLFNDYAPVIDNAYKELATSRKPYDFTLQTKTPLGYVKWVRIVGFPLVVNDEVTGSSGIVHDVTVFKESEERIRANERNYRLLFEQASDAIMITDFKGNFLDVNSAMCSMLGYTRDELLQTTIANTIDPEQLKINPIRFDKLMIGEQLFNERRMIRKNKTGVFVEANVKMFGEGKIMAIARDITSRREIEQEKEKTRYALNERIKELTTLYKVSQILQTESKPVHEVLQEIVLILPAGWQYPPITAARISLAAMEFVTPNFGEFKHRQFSEFITPNGMHGSIEVVYLENKPDEVEGAFVAEERHLINMIADMLRIYLSRRYEAETLRRTEANQSATINNTNFYIWSVNREYEIISFNKPFAEFSLKQFGIEVKVGTRLTDENYDLRARWTARYNRALAGETFKISSELNNQQYEYSLNPIIEDGKVIGVSVFGEDVSERIRLEKEMLAVNKQVGELRLMALRSVMNPHFIFNCLNSIQYYIMENDQVNAVNYLSTFSKLIRSILNNSVRAKVRLNEELDMLNHYVQLESIRFENKFDTVFNVKTDIDMESVEIPSMLIQPYVENAILHGLNNKKGKGLLKISVRLENGMVMFEIEDDGIGRKASAKLKDMNMTRHQSMGTALTEERLRLINEKGMASVEIEDLETDGKPAGTKVNVRIKE